MTKAELAAYKAYPYETGTKGLICKNSRQIFIRGYEQAEKDLALTWQDIAKIDDMLREVGNCIATSDLPTMGREDYYTEVLKRFNEIR